MTETTRLRSPAGLVDQARSDLGFARHGVVTGQFGSVHWVVVDPARHPLTVWRGHPSGRRATALDAVVVTNGPMMGRRLLRRWKVTRGLLAAVPTATGAVLGVAVGVTVARRSRQGLAGLGAGAGAAFGLAGAAAVAIGLLSAWTPCGVVRGAAAGIDDCRDFDDEGRGHAWLGRATGGDPGATGFASIGIGDGPLPDTVVEGTGGLVRLVRDHQVATGGDLTRLAGRRGTAAWGLVPTSGLDDQGEPDGVVVVIGSATLDVAEAAVVLQAMGARHAVAADPSGCALLVAGGRVLVGPPSWVRRRIQVYGLACAPPV